PRVEGATLNNAITTVAPAARALRRRALVLAVLLLVLAAVTLLLTAGPTAGLEGERRLFGLWRTRHVAFALGLAWCAGALGSAGISGRAWRRFCSVNGALAVAWVALELAAAAGLLPLGMEVKAGGPPALGVAALPHL